MDKNTRIKIIKFKYLVGQSYQWYGLLINGPMVAYIFYKSSDIKWLALAAILGGLIMIAIIAIIWYKYFAQAELEFNSNLNPSWRKLLEDKK